MLYPSTTAAVVCVTKNPFVSMNFKHTGVFPEQAANWDFIGRKIAEAGRPVSVLNLFAYTGAATLAAAAAGASVCHVDAAKGMEKQAIIADKLVYAYPGQDEQDSQVVFEGLDLAIAQGSFVAILGHNGCGKSTLAKHFNAILLPSGGKVWVYGKDTADESQLIPIRREVGMLTYTTSPIALTDGLELLLGPLKKLHLPIHGRARRGARLG